MYKFLKCFGAFTENCSNSAKIVIITLTPEGSFLNEGVANALLFYPGPG
jgi:hypothetical protein